MQNDTQLIFEFLQQNYLMTLATADLHGKPQAATVHYLMDGNDLLINTYVQYRKYANISVNPLVAGVVTSKDDNKTLQFDAKIIEATGNAAEQIKQKMLVADPGSKEFFDDKATRFFRIKPYWLRLRDYTVTPTKEVELSL